MGSTARQLPLIVLAFLILSLVELIGLGILIPYIEFVVIGDFSTVGIDILKMISLDKTPREDLLLVFSILIIFAFLLKFGLGLMMIGIINSFAQRQRVALGSQLLEISLNQKFIDYLKRSDADGVYEIQTVTAHYFTALQLVLKSFSDLLIMFFIVAFMAVIEPIVLAATIVAMVTILGGYLFLSRKHLVKLGKQANAAESAVINLSQDSFRGYRELRLLGKAGAFVEYLRLELSKAGRASVQLGYHSVMPRHLIELSAVLLFVAAFVIAQTLSIDQRQSTGVAIVYVLAVMRMLPLMTGITAAVARFRSMKDSIDRIFGYMAKSDEDVFLESPKSHAGPGRFKKLQFSKVCFSYPGSDNILFEDLNLTICRGETIGIVGQSGSGKTTFINMLAGFLEPDKGTVLHNGVPILRFASSDLGIGYVPQETLSVNGSVLNNVILGDADDASSRRRAKDALRATQLENVINNMSQGLDSPIGQSGSLLSGGQRQRMAVARAIYHGKEIIILDEATNALDVDTEEKLIKALLERSNFGALVIVSHRLSTLKFCDRIFHIGDAGLAEVSDRETFFKNQLEHYRDQRHAS